jgi:flagellar hook assembly protein FlgD
VHGVADPTPVSGAPRELSLGQNVPNPFNPTTRIGFTLPEASHVNIRIFDVHGRLVATLLDRALPAGAGDVLWNGRDERGAAVSSGVYFYRLSASGRQITKKMVLLK